MMRVCLIHSSAPDLDGIVLLGLCSAIAVRPRPPCDGLGLAGSMPLTTTQYHQWRVMRVKMVLGVSRFRYNSEEVRTRDAFTKFTTRPEVASHSFNSTVTFSILPVKVNGSLQAKSTAGPTSIPMSSPSPRKNWGESSSPFELFDQRETVITNANSCGASHSPLRSRSFV